MFDTRVGRWSCALAVLGATLGVAACGDDDGMATPDSGGDTDSGMTIEDGGPPPEDAGEDDTGVAVDSGPMYACPIQGALTVASEPRMARLTGTSTNPSTTCTAMTGTGGPEHWYTLEIATRTGVRITAQSPTVELAVAVRTACDDPLSDVACATPGVPGAPPPPPGGPVEPTTVATVLEPGTYFVLVDVIGFGVGGDYTIGVETFTPAMNATCDTATTVMNGTTLANQSTADTVTTSFSCPMFSPTLRPLYYSATVPAGNRLSVRTSWVPSAGGTPPSPGPNVVIASSCDPASCVADGLSSATYSNVGAAAETVIIAIGPGMFEPILDATFDLQVAIEPLATNRTCTAASPLMLGVPTMGDFGLGDSSTFMCTTMPPPGPLPTGLLYYSVTIPAGRTLAASVREIGGYLDPWIAVLESCTATTCLVEANGPPAPQQSITYTNMGASAANVILVVGRRAGMFAPSQTFEISADVLTPQTNLTCATATFVSDGDALTFENAAEATASLASTCESAATGNVLFYRATVPPGETLRAHVRTTGWAPLVRVLGACDATSCAAVGRGPMFPGPMGGGTARIEYANVTASAVDVIVAVGPDGGAAGGLFDLTVNIGATAYATTTITASCEDTAGGTAVSGVSGDDTGSATMALPFAVDLFGTAVTHYGISSNGFVQLFASAGGGVTLPGFTNTPLPDAMPPNGIIAALWDDLFPEGSVRTLVAGSGTERRLVVEWNGFSRFSARMMPARFQVKIFETTDVIEIHYCSFASGFATNSATVGIEDLGGLDAVQHSFDGSGAISAGTGVRFTPPAP